MEAAAAWRRLNKSCRIYGDGDDTLFRLIAIGNAKVWVRFAQPFLIQMGDAKAHKWMMPKHG